MAEDEVKPIIKSYRRAMKASEEYVKPYWEDFLRLYKYWHLKKPDILTKTYSRISLNLFHTMVQEKIPKIYRNVFSNEDMVTVSGSDPRSEMFSELAQAWLRDMLSNRIKLQHTIMPTIQSAMIGGNGFRMPTVNFVKNSEGKYERRISGRNLDFFNVLPSPGGGQINPFDNDTSSALEWAFVIDWWSEEKIKALAEKGVLDKDQVGRMLDTAADTNYPETQ